MTRDELAGTTTPAQPKASTPHADDPDSDEERSSNRRFAALIFIAVAFGQIIGLAASVSDARDLAAPILDIVSPAPELRIVGSGTILGEELQMAGEWQAGFEAAHSWDVAIPLVGTLERTVNVTIDAVGTLEGFKQTGAGTVHLLAASEPIPAAEQQQFESQGITLRCAAEIGFDTVAFVTDMNNTIGTPVIVDPVAGEDSGEDGPTRSLSWQDLSEILGGQQTDWSAFGGKPGPINILYRSGSGTTDIVMQAFGLTELPANAQQCDSNEKCLDFALSTPGSLYWVSSAWLRTQPPRYLNVIPLRKGDASLPENPLSETFQPDNYRSELNRPLYMYVLSGGPVNPRSSDLAKDFLVYVRSVRGQEILESHSFHTFFDPPVGVKTQLPAGFGAEPGNPPVVCR